jgi:hypothetical protein
VESDATLSVTEAAEPLTLVNGFAKLKRMLAVVKLCLIIVIKVRNFVTLLGERLEVI